MAPDIKLENYISDNIEEAVESGWIKAYFQPVIRTLTGKTAGYEALARWIDPVHGFLTPDIFIPVLENCGKICLLDMYILEQICKCYSELKKNGKNVVPFSFNLSRKDLQREDLHEAINEVLDRYEVPHKMIHVEITESIASMGEISLEAHIERFHKDGYEVWMDDFGSGYSTLNTLQNHSFDTLKLDMMFLRNFNDKAAEIIQSIVKLAKKLNTGTVCEGVETAEQVEFLRKAGCERLQGWHFSKPQPFEALSDFHDNSEPFEDQVYWNVVSRQDTASLKPWMILEYSEHSWRIIDINCRMKQTIEELHPEGLEETLRESLASDNQLSYVFDEILMNVSATRAEQQLDFIDNGCLVVLSVYYLASTENRHALKVTARVIHAEFEHQKNNLINEGLVGLYSQYQLVNMLKPDEDSSLQIYSNANFEKVYGRTGLRRGIAEFAATEVYPDDRDRYLEFMNMDNIGERIAESGTRFISNAFRMRMPNGGYKWKIVTLLSLPAGVERKYLFELQEAGRAVLNSLKLEYGDSWEQEGSP
ncbi:MAG: EAL domain-containing protein [Oscillospiraceae bacterium]|nr:EAL domain-containing protein [Oscillospiraceae bacterium]